MMTVCYDEGTLEAYLDRELTNDLCKDVEDHVKSCLVCRRRLAQLTQEQTFADAKTRAYLAVLKGDQNKAWHNLEQAWPQDKSKFPNKKGAIFMLLNYRKAAAAGVAIAVLGVSLTFAPVRAFADNLLNIFRINQVQSVSLDTEDFTQIEKALQHGAGKITLGDMGQVEMSKTGQSGPVSLAQAQQSTDFKLLLPAKLPEGYSRVETQESAGGTLSFTLNTEKTNSILQDLGATTLLPPSLNGKTFTAKIPTVVQTTYQGADTLVVAEARTPELTAPGDADVGAIRDALLALPFLPDNLRQQLMAINDWQHTLIVPALNGASQNVTVAGTQGVYVTESQGTKTENAKTHTALIWQKDGIVYGLLGNFSVNEGLDIANSMQ